MERRKYLDFLEIFSLSFSSSWKHFVSSSMGPGQHDSFFLSFVHIRNFGSTAGMNKEQSFKKFSHCDLLFTWENFYLPQTNLRVCCS